MEVLKKKRGRSSRAILNMTTGEVYPSVSEAAKQLGVAGPTVTMAAQGRIGSVKGNCLTYHGSVGVRRETLHRVNGRPTLSVKLPEIILSKDLYDRLSRAATGSGETITSAVIQAIGALLDAHDRGEVVITGHGRRVGAPTRAVIELDSNTIFNSVSEAARHFDMSGAAVSVIAGGFRKKTKPGRRFAYLDTIKKNDPE